MKIITMFLAIFTFSAFAAEPTYWMKAYPDASQAKVDQCLVVAEDAYDKSLKGGMDGVFWAVLAKGNAWEACMERK